MTDFKVDSRNLQSCFCKSIEEEEGNLCGKRKLCHQKYSKKAHNNNDDVADADDDVRRSVQMCIEYQVAIKNWI